MKYNPFYDVAWKGRLYKRTVYALLAAALLLISVFYLIVSGIMVRHKREALASSNLDLLELSASSVNVSLDVMSHAMTQTLWNQDFIHFMVTPRSDDQGLNTRISRILQRGVDGNSLILHAYFYSPRSDLVFHSGPSLLSRQSQTVDKALTAYENGQLLSFGSTDRDQTRLCNLSGQLFLYRELNVASPLGALVYELDRSALEAQLLKVSDVRFNVQVYDPQGVRVLGAAAQDFPDLDFGDDGAFLTPDNMAERAARMTRGWYLFEDANGWRYVLPMDHASLSLSVREIFISYVPMFLVLLVLAGVIAWYSGRAWYYPINRLMRQVATDAPAGKVRDEAEILAQSYSSARAEQDQLRGIIAAISPDILSSMLKNLVNGKHLTEERVGSILNGIGDPLPLRGSFTVIVCQVVSPGEEPVADADFNLYLLSVHKLCENMPYVGCRIEVLHTDVLTIALVCSAPQGAGASDVLNDAKTIVQTLRRNAQGLPFQVLCGIGMACSELLNVRYSYKEARERVQYQRYLYSTGSAGECAEAEDAADTAPLDPDSIQARVRDMMGCAADGDIPRSERLLDRLLREMERNSAGDSAAVRSAVCSLHDALLERVITYPLSPEEQSSALLRPLSSEQIDAMSPEELFAATRSHAAGLFRLAAAYGQKSRYKYIDQAKQYISENYMDSSLSLNSVGDYVGISASYLSELWSEVTHEKFSAYLSVFRVEKAQQLLSTTELTIKEIGFRCGFNSAQSFIRVFKKYTGLSPGQFRERQEA